MISIFPVNVLLFGKLGLRFGHVGPIQCQSVTELVGSTQPVPEQWKPRGPTQRFP